MIVRGVKEVLGQQTVRESRSTTNATWISLVLNPVLRGKSPTVSCPYHGKSKGKAFPLQAWTGPEGSRRLRLPDFKTIGT